MRRERRGNAILEFALSLGLLLSALAGVWEFGYTFYLYNNLESAVRNGARYGSLADYDGGSWNGADFTRQVQNMVVYGNPDPASGARPVVLGLDTSHVKVTPQLRGLVPQRITVAINDFTVSTCFRRLTLNN